MIVLAQPFSIRSLPCRPMRFQTGDKRDPFCQMELDMAKRSQLSEKICLDVQAVQHCVNYTFQHIIRLEAAGRFPKRIHLGRHRIGWALRDILSWMQSKVDARPVGPMSPKVVIEPGDRFIDKKELRALVLYSSHHIRKMEYAGTFPGHIRIGDNRIAWLEKEVKEWQESRRLAEKAPPLTTYQVRLCRPRFEIADVRLKAGSPEAAKQMALVAANTDKPEWHILPYEPEAYRPHVEICVQDEHPFTPSDTKKDNDCPIRYLMLAADTASGKGTVFLHPWFSGEKLGDRASNIIADWVLAFNRSIKPNKTRQNSKRDGT